VFPVISVIAGRDIVTEAECQLRWGELTGVDYAPDTAKTLYNFQ
jgi:hypothetical protein